MDVILCHLVNSAVDKNDKTGFEGHVMLRSQASMATAADCPSVAG